MVIKHHFWRGAIYFTQTIHQYSHLPSTVGASATTRGQWSVSRRNECQSVLLSQPLLLFQTPSQEVVQVLDNIEIHRPERQEGPSVKGLAVDPGGVCPTHLEMAQMKSMETEHLYLGASSWSSWLTLVSSCRVTREEI